MPLLNQLFSNNFKYFKFLSKNFLNFLIYLNFSIATKPPYFGQKNWSAYQTVQEMYTI